MRRILLPILPILFTWVSPALAQEIKLANHRFLIDGKPFFIKGIGYEAGAWPGSLPWARVFNEPVLRADMKRIRDAGFNTIRTWAPLTSMELKVVQEFGLKVIMGIWIDPAGDFSSPYFVAQSKALVSEVLTYSGNYPNIIAYLIMNEPMPEVIAREGYGNAVALWKELTALIHQGHPDRPVSISNSSNGTYIEAGLFDFPAYNAYPYNPVTVNFLHGYREYISYLNRMHPLGAPLVITEYGLSVSPSGPGNWGYGGNTPEEQEAGILYMYRSLVDGGAGGSCLFNYSDGWWKGGDERIHNDNPEEWFGLVRYSSLSDLFGQERPVWQSVKAYQSAIIAQPRNSEVYSGRVPVEIFAGDTIHRIRILRDTIEIAVITPVGGYVMDTVTPDQNGSGDTRLVFECLDTSGKMIKSEEKIMLVSDSPNPLPTIEISVSDPDFWSKGFIDVVYRIRRPDRFTSASTLDYAFYPHVGWEYGHKYQTTLPGGCEVEFSTRHYFNANVSVITLGAAFNCSLGSFQKRIVNQRTFSRINTVAGLPFETHLPVPDLRVQPNPAESYFRITGENLPFTHVYELTIHRSDGTPVMPVRPYVPGQLINIQGLSPGIYFVLLRIGSSATISQKLIKLG